MRTILFENADHRRFLPLSALNAVPALRCGILPLWCKAVLDPGEGPHGLVVREAVGDAWLLEPHGLPDAEGDEETLWLDAAVLWRPEYLEQARSLTSGRSLRNSDGLVLAAVAATPSSWTAQEGSLPERLAGLTESEAEVEWDRPSAWFDLIRSCPDEILRDVERLGLQPSGPPPDGVSVMGEGPLFIAADALIAPGVVLDVRGGPIVLGEGVEVLPHAYLQGPCHVGAGSLVRAGATLYEGCSLGPRCKVGGELEHALLQGFANKQHEGYLGNAVVGPWVNLGAGTHNSDLKNTYGPVSTTVDGERVDTGLTFLGCCLGDHTKTSIGTVLNTGTVTGVGCNLFGAGFHPQHVPGFVRGQPGRYREYLLAQVLETARAAMGRRQVTMSAAYEDLMRVRFDETGEERTAFLGRRMHGG